MRAAPARAQGARRALSATRLRCPPRSERTRPGSERELGFDAEPEPDQDDGCDRDLRHRLGGDQDGIEGEVQRARIGDADGKRNSDRNGKREAVNAFKKRGPGLAHEEIVARDGSEQDVGGARQYDAAHGERARVRLPQEENEGDTEQRINGMPQRAPAHRAIPSARPARCSSAVNSGQ